MKRSPRVGFTGMAPPVPWIRTGRIAAWSRCRTTPELPLRRAVSGRSAAGSGRRERTLGATIGSHRVSERGASARPEPREHLLVELARAFGGSEIGRAHV